MNRKEYDTPKGKAVFEYDGNGVGHITLECMDMLMDMVASSMWTPCSEGLPKKPGIYTVTDNKGDVVRFVFHDTESSREYWSRCAKAWMPLPEPWKGADDED